MRCDADKLYYNGCVFSLNISESDLFAEFVKRLKNNTFRFSRVRSNEERARANTTITVIKIARLLYFRFESQQATPHWPKVIASSLKAAMSRKMMYR